MLELLGLLGQRRDAAAAFFHQRGVLLRHLVHLRHRLVDLLDAAALVLGGLGDLAQDLGHMPHRLDDFAMV